MSYSIEVREIPAVDAAYLTETVPHTEIGNAFMRMLPAAFQYIVMNGAQPAGAPFGRYPDWRESDCVMDAGAPFSGNLTSGESVRVGTLGGFLAAVLSYYGPYDGIHAAHGECHQWLTQQGYQVAGSPCEFYLTDPSSEPDPSKWLTEIVWPIEKA